MQAGIDGKNSVFLFSDTQIVSEAFVEDVNNILNSGDVPGMFTADEKDRIAIDVRDWADKRGYSITKEGCFSSFIDRVRHNLHIVLSMSPVGDKFRSRCRQFPSLINCCSIDWYTEWPDEALLSVSNKARSDFSSMWHILAACYNFSWLAKPIQYFVILLQSL
jgi:dynein heavy chain, axonemal